MVFARNMKNGFMEFGKINSFSDVFEAYFFLTFLTGSRRKESMRRFGCELVEILLYIHSK